MSNSGNLTSYSFRAHAARAYRWVWPAHASAAAGTALVEGLPKDETGANIGSPLTFFTGTPVSGDQVFSGYTDAMPAGTRQLAIRATLIGTGMYIDWSAPTIYELPDIQEAPLVYTDDLGYYRLEFFYPTAIPNTVQINARGAVGAGGIDNLILLNGQASQIILDVAGGITLFPGVLTQVVTVGPGRALRVQHQFGGDPATAQADDGYLLPPQTAPSAPASGYHLYDDTSDGHLKVIDSASTVTTLVPGPTGASGTLDVPRRSPTGADGSATVVNGLITALTDPTSASTVGDFGANDLTTRHYLSNGSTPSYTAGPGAGTTPTITVVGTDTAGTVTVVAGTAPNATKTIVIVTFAAAFAAAPYPLITPGNGLTAALSPPPFMDGSSVGTVSWSIKANGTALTAGQTYVWYFQVLK